jgi:hydrogenase maturation protein HypF
LRPEAPRSVSGGGKREGFVIETRGIITAVVEDLLAARPAGEISFRFHQTMAEIVAAGCVKIREASLLEAGKATAEDGAVALSGGTFQNALLLELVVERLTQEGFAVYRHRRVPANDGGLSLGQAVLADGAFRRAWERGHPARMGE